MKHLAGITKRAFFLAAVAAVLISPVTAALLPVFEGAAQAQGTLQPSGFNTFQNRMYQFHDDDTPNTFQTCKPVFTSDVLSLGDVEEAQNWDLPPTAPNEIAYLEARVGQSVPVIDWVHVAQSDMPASRIINGSYRNGGAGICDSLSPMLPVATNRWKGQHFQNRPFGESPVSYAMVFTRTSSGGQNTAGDFDFYCGFVGDQCPESARRQTQLVVEGSPSGSGSGALVRLGLDARWADAATIILDRPTGSGGGAGVAQEVYRMVSWRAHDVSVNNAQNESEEWSVYFLSEAPGARSDQVWDSSRGCQNPIRVVDGEQHPSGDCQALNGENFNCVPFIAVHQNINLSRPGGSGTNLNIDGSSDTSFVSRVNALGNAGAIRYDYREDCSYMGNSGPSEQPIAAAANARIWFYQSADRERLATVFPSGAGLGNEAPYTGVYSQVATEQNQSVRIYEGGANDCNGRARVTQQSNAPGGRLTTNWTLFPENCQGANGYGSVGVFALGGDAGAENFNRVSAILPPVEVPEGEVARVGCSYEFINPLTWIICPVIDISRGLIEWVDGGINSMLDINPFSENVEEGGLGSAAVESFRGAWAVFRTLALAVIVIAALVMVVAQAAGLEIMDAYTIRKVLPRLLLAAIGITLSWQLAMLAITISNDLGQGVRAIIFAPFGESIDATVGGGTAFILGLLGGGAIIAFGLLALLSFALTGAIAVLIAFALLAFREIAVIALTIVMPIAIACAILPNTQKIWDLWRKTYLMLLAAFVIIMAFIAVGRVFAATSVTAGNNAESGFWGGFMQLIGIIAYFAPYFMIPFVFKMAGGMMAAVGGFASQGIKRMNAPLQQYRGGKAKANMANLKAGQRFQGVNVAGLRWTQRVAGAANKTTAAAGLGVRGRFGMGRQGQQAAYQQQFTAAQELMKTADFQSIQDIDDAMQAGMYGSESAAAQALTERWTATEGAERAQERARNAVASVKAAGLQFGKPLQYASAMQAVNTATTFGNMQDMVGGLARASGGNTAAASALAGFANAQNKKNGRWDLAPGFTTLDRLVRNEMSPDATGRPSQLRYDQATVQAWREASSAGQTWSSIKPMGVDNLGDVWQRIESGQYGTGAEVETEVSALRDNVIATVMEGRQNIPYASDANREKLEGIIEGTDTVPRMQGAIEERGQELLAGTGTVPKVRITNPYIDVITGEDRSPYTGAGGQNGQIPRPEPGPPNQTAPPSPPPPG